MSAATNSPPAKGEYPEGGRGFLPPKLRFPEFDGGAGWEMRKIGDMLAETPRPIELEDEADYCLVTVRRRYGGLVSRGILKGKEIKVNTQFLVRTDDFLISKRQIVHDACGLVSPELDGAVVSNEYSVLTAREGCSVEFIHWFAQQPCVSASFLECSVGIVIEKMLFKLNLWLKRDFSFPTLLEQQKIADCLSSLDELIAAQARKVETLKTHKKGLTQQLFPGEGESQSRVRLPDFLDSDDWNENYLGRLVVIRSGNSPSRYELSHEGKYPFVKVEDLNNCEKYQEASREYSDEMNGLIPKGSVLFPKRGAAIALNKIRLSNRELLMDTNMMALTPVDGCLPEFLFYLISQVGLNKIADSSTIPQINNKHIIPFAVLIPEIEEQQRIADCLTSLDELITAATQELDALKTHKNGLMQQLFPAQEEMAA